MAYVDKILAAGERILYRGSLHWIVYASGLILAVAAVGVAIAVSVLPDGRARSTLLIAATLGLVAGVLQLLVAYARASATEIVVTDRRIIYKTGLLSIKSVEMNRDKIESVVVDQDLAGRLLNYGTVVVRGVGAGLEPVVLLADPLEFRRQIGA